EETETRAAAILDSLKIEHLRRIASLFDIAESVRYSSGTQGVPHLPIGTAQLIDTIEIFMTRERQDDGVAQTADRNIDWAASVKLAPLFESDVLEPGELERFARTLPSPFSSQFARQLLIIAASGMHF